LTKKVEPVWFKEDLQLEEFIDWAKMVGVFIRKDHLTLAFQIVADPLTNRISCEKLRSMLCSDLEVSSALKVLVHNSGKVKFDIENTNVTNRLTELLQSTQFFMELSLLLNNHKQYNQINVLFSRYVSEVSIKCLVDHLKLEVNILISIIIGGNPYETKVNLSDDLFMRQSEQLYVEIANTIVEGQIEMKENALKMYQKNSQLILDQLKAIQRMLEELVSYLNPGGNYMSARIIKTIARQTREMLDKTSALTPGFFGLGSVVVERLNKLGEMVSRVKFLDGEISLKESRQYELYRHDSSGYHLLKQSYNELIYQLRSAKESLTQFFTSVNEVGKAGYNLTQRYDVIKRNQQSANDSMSGRTRLKMKMVESEAAHEEAHIFREVESRINALRMKLKSPPVHKRLEDNNSIAIVEGSTSARVNEVKLLSIESKIERALEILIALKKKTTPISSNIK